MFFKTYFLHFNTFFYIFLNPTNFFGSLMINKGNEYLYKLILKLCFIYFIIFFILFSIAIYKKYSNIFILIIFLLLLLDISIVLELTLKQSYISINILLLGVGAILMLFLYTSIILGTSNLKNLNFWIFFNKLNGNKNLEIAVDSLLFYFIICYGLFLQFFIPNFFAIIFISFLNSISLEIMQETTFYLHLVTSKFSKNWWELYSKFFEHLGGIIVLGVLITQIIILVIKFLSRRQKNDKKI